MAKKKTTKKATKKTSPKSTKKKVTKKTTSKKVPKKKKTTTKKVVKKEAAKKTTKKKATKKVAKKKVSKKTASKKVSTKKKASKKSAPTKNQSAPKVDSAQEQVSTAGGETQLTDQQMRKVKTGLTKRDLEYFEKLLLEKKSEISGNVTSIDTTRTNSIENSDSHIPLHMADAGSDNYEQDFMIGLVESEKDLLSEINEAIERISSGTYGVCVISGKPIAKARLEIQPWAKYCIEVARQREQ